MMKRSRFKNDEIFTIISGDITGSSIDKLFQNIMRGFVGDLPQADEFPAFVNVQSGGYLTLSRMSPLSNFLWHIGPLHHSKGGVRNSWRPFSTAKRALLHIVTFPGHTGHQRRRSVAG